MNYDDLVYAFLFFIYIEVCVSGQIPRDKRMSIVHLGFTGERSVAIRDAVRAILDGNLVGFASECSDLFFISVAIVVAGIGDSSSYSCLTTPANIPDVVVVAGVDPGGNVMLPFSNFGECLTVKAPGVLTSSAVHGMWATSSINFGWHPNRGVEASRASSAGAAAIISGLAAVLNDHLTRDSELSTDLSGAQTRRSIVNFIRNGSMLHFQQNNDPTIHKYPYTPCTILEIDDSWNKAITRLVGNVKSVLGTSHVFNHFERVRKQFMESSKHNS